MVRTLRENGTKRNHRTDKKKYQEGMNEQHQMEQREYWKGSVEFVGSEVNNVITESSFSGVMRKEIRTQHIKKNRR